MISAFQIEARLYDYFNTIFGSNATAFGFSASASASFIVGRYYDTVRPAVSTVLVYDVNNITTLGNTQSVDSVSINRTTGNETVDMLRRADVTVNIISKFKGSAKDAMSFLIASNQTTRGYEACYPSLSASSFDIALSNITEIKDLSEIENGMWTERIEAEFNFNFADTLSFGVQGLITAPSSVDLTKTKIDFDIEVK